MNIMVGYKISHSMVLYVQLMAEAIDMPSLKNSARMAGTPIVAVIRPKLHSKFRDA